MKIAAEFQESLSTDNSVLIQSVLCVHSPDTGLEHSTSQIRFITTQRPMQFRSCDLHSLCRPHSPSAIRNELPRLENTVQILPFAYLI